MSTRPEPMRPRAMVRCPPPAPADELAPRREARALRTRHCPTEPVVPSMPVSLNRYRRARLRRERLIE